MQNNRWQKKGTMRAACSCCVKGYDSAGIFTMQHPELVDRRCSLVQSTATARDPAGWVPSSTSALPQWRLVTAKNQHDRFVAEVPKGHDPVLLDRHFQPWARAYMATDSTSNAREPQSVKVPNGPLADLIDAWRGKLAYDPAGREPAFDRQGEWDSLSDNSDAIWLLAAATSSPNKQYVKIPEATHLMPSIAIPDRAAAGHRPRIGAFRRANLPCALSVIC